MRGEYKVKINIRISETDALGHVNNTSYFDYIEESTNNFYRQLKIPLDTKINFVLAKVSCEFIKQAFHSDTLRLNSFPVKIGNKSITLVTHIFNERTDELVAKGESVLVYFDTDAQQSLLIPADMKEKLAKYRREENDETI